ncbi:MAG: ATP-binding protein [Deltaproteobacteria bacterium]
MSQVPLPARSALERLRDWLGASMYRRVGFTLGATTLAFALAVDTVSYVTARAQINASVEQLLETESRYEVERMSTSLNSTVEAVAVLARSRLLSNALVDSDGRLAYVAPFLRDFQAGRGRKIALTLVDYRGNAIATTRIDGGTPAVDTATAARFVEQGRPHAGFAGPRDAPILVIAWPVLFPETRTAEGLLIAEFDARSVLHSVPPAAGRTNSPMLRVSDESGNIISSEGAATRWVGMLSRSERLPVADVLDPLGLRVEVGVPRFEAYKPLRYLALIYLVGTVAVVLAALGVARLVAERLTRPIRRLSVEAAQIADSSRLDSGVAVEGRDEIAQLARSFNEMLLRLQLTTESRLAALREQNAELVRAHAAQQRLEEELHHAQKLEAVGRLASGIAHEINTPIQYIGDNTRFLADAVDSLSKALDGQRQELDRIATPDVLTRIDRVGEELDLPYIRTEAPRTVARTLEGVRRVATIVRAMREFSHPGESEPVAADINRSLEATLDVARNEYRYVADVVTEFGQLPLVTCRPGDLNQAFLNVIVNAAHAIEDVVQGTDGRGTIRVRTSADGDAVVVAISDTGGGIPAEARGKVFEPFFTTKDVGRGSGQGLAITRSIVEAHGGSITFETAQGTGTTFRIRIPLVPPATSSAPAEAPEEP